MHKTHDLENNGRYNSIYLSAILLTKVITGQQSGLLIIECVSFEASVVYYMGIAYTLYGALLQYTLYSIQFKLYTVHCTIYTCMYNVHGTLVHFTLHTLNSIKYSIYDALYSVQFKYCTSSKIKIQKCHVMKAFVEHHWICHFNKASSHDSFVSIHPPNLLKRHVIKLFYSYVSFSCFLLRSIALFGIFF